MLAPARDGVALAADADGGEDRVPELVHRFLLGKSGEDFLRPARNGDGCDAPGAGIGHYGAYVRLDGRLAAARARQAVGVYAEQRLRITGGDIEKCCALVSIAVEHFCLPGGKDVEHGVIRAQKALAFKKIIRPAHHDFAAADVIGSGGAQACKIRALDRAADHDGLALLHIQTDFNEQLCIFSEFFFHEDPPQKKKAAVRGTAAFSYRTMLYNMHHNTVHARLKRVFRIFIRFREEARQS